MIRPTLSGVWHTGTHTALKILGDGVRLVHVDQLSGEPSRPLILTMRHPMDTFRSWRLRHHEFAAEFFFGLWRRLFALGDKPGSLWMPVDTADRDERLAKIEDRLNRRVAHDWSRENVRIEFDLPPILNWRAWRNPKTSPVVRESEARAFFATLPFGQFGYEP